MHAYIMICLGIVLLYGIQIVLLSLKVTGVEKMVIFHVKDFERLSKDKQEKITSIVKANFMRMLLLHSLTLIGMTFLVMNIKNLYVGVERVYPLILLGISLMVTSFDAVVTTQKIEGIGS